ncbi:PEP-CTERM sorting domain-containing protein [Massilia sp. W12]|uniref:PEP-CTERM sorting domain-containing protein n=1 Tax=Massilia sp. W12 TaxID=3126507 RepID=UPI0030CB38CA
MTTSHFTSTIAGITLAFASSASMADNGQSTSSNSAISYQYQVIDLAPDDGVTAGVDFYIQNSLSSAQVRPHDPWIGKHDFNSGKDSSSAGISLGDQAAYAWGSAATGLASKGYAYSDGGYSASHSFSSSYSLTPHSVLVIFGTFSGAASATKGDESMAHTYMSLSGYVDGKWMSDSASHSWSENNGDSSSHYFKFTFSNNTARYGYGSVSATSSVFGSVNHPAPVPEAETWAMLGGGLLALTALRRKRAKRK